MPYTKVKTLREIMTFSVYAYVCLYTSSLYLPVEQKLQQVYKIVKNFLWNCVYVHWEKQQKWTKEWRPMKR